MLVNKFNYIKLNRESVDGSRVYLTPDGSKVASVTTILDKTKPLEKVKSLHAWRRRVGETEAQKITTEASSRGTRMHTYLENYIKGQSLKETVTNPYAQQSLVMAKKVIEQGFSKITEVWGNEVSLYYPGLYAGTTDCVGLHEGSEAILDFKQTNKPKKREWIEDYFLQLAAYAIAHDHLHGTNINRGVIMMCAKPEELGKNLWSEPVYQEFVVDGSDFKFWTNCWWDRLQEYYQKY
jgi:ATP-dependent exoDNAse (exonuclease V) beta subunit